MLNLSPVKPRDTVPMHKTADEMGIKPLTELALAVMAASGAIVKARLT